MKTLLSIFAVLFTLNSTMAESPIDPSLPGYVPCSEGDLRLLETSTLTAEAGIKNLVLEHILAERISCAVEKPRFFHPAVCGTAITQVDTFAITTQEGGNYQIVVDSSYRSCLRMRVIPTIKSLNFQPTTPSFFP